ncbi:MAG TPA: FAD-dependent oxidoreductase [Candidatus Limnocylindrales bacterium]|nr:FAD-dependent oxidoreductase [Candidatus Limnocylindrales bacterium]
MAGDYASVSYWLESAGDDLTPRPPLASSGSADVAILGAGYSGLWTAYYLLKAQPGLRVVLLEREIAGFGASGRNGAWCAPGLNISLGRLARLHGDDAARRTYAAVWEAVDEVGRVAKAEGFEIDWRRGGELIVSRGSHETPALHAEMSELEKFGFGDRGRLLTAEELAERVRIDGGEAALYLPDAATIQPAKLARGLARTIERMGATIHERTEVVDFRGRRGSRQAALVTAAGEVSAEVVVLAGEAYLTRLRQLHRSLIPIWSLIVLTEPLPDEVWADIGWQDHELIGSPRYTVVYLSRTTDRRLLFGGRGAPYRFGSPIRDEYDRHAPTHEMLRQTARRWFPALRQFGFTHAWGGPLGMPRDWHPTIAFDRRTGLASARGYVGHGVSAANLAGRTLAELILEQETERTGLPLVNHRSRSWEPEPFRWLGVRFTQAALERVDRIAEQSGRPPQGRSLEEWLARH